MAITELNKFLAKIKSADLEGRYIFAGEEDFLIRHYLRELARAVIPDEAFAAFNHVIYDGGEIDFMALADAIESPPMMSEYKLVEWRYADFSRMLEEDLDSLDELVKMHEEHPQTVLVISAVPGSIEFSNSKRSKKLLARLKDFDILNFKPSSDKQLYSWIERHFAVSGLRISLSAARAMVDRIGHSMDTLKGEIDKLTAYVLSRGGTEVTLDDVFEACTYVPENGDFDFQNAIVERDRAKAFSALEEMKLERVDPIAIFAIIGSAYSDMLDVIMLLKDGKSREDIAKMKNMHIFKVGIYANNSKKHTLERICEVTDALSRADVGIKRGGVGGYSAVELFLSKYI